MRLDHYLPYAKSPGRGREPPPRSRPYRWAKKILPASLFSDFTTQKKRGLIRRLLRKMGPAWLSAPFRRSIQVACFALFCLLFFYICWPYSAAPNAGVTGWPSHYADDFAAKEWVDAESFLALDPLLSISTAIASRRWIWSLAWAAAILGIGILIPRGFCSYICPLGTLIDLFDWTIGKRVKYFQIKGRGKWVHLKYYLLAGVLIAALFGVLLSGFVAAIPVVTRGFTFILAPLQLGLARGWYQVPPMNTGHLLSVLLFLAVLVLGLFQPRFWCRYVCPTGAIFSLCNLFARVGERKVEHSCIDCGQCVKVCPFDAIKADFTTRTVDCTFCQTCAGICPPSAIKFVDRWNAENLKNEQSDDEIPLSRRCFLAAAAAGLSAAFGVKSLYGAHLTTAESSSLPVRPPMSVPEEEFLEMCIRCGLCFKVCPNSVLQPLWFDQGLEGLWTPQVVADWSGCEPSCNNCGQVCPTGAIRALPIGEKRVARIGLAQVEPACLPRAGESACQLCADECRRAGYEAIEFERVHPQFDDDGFPIEGTGFVAPVVIPDSCVGCGLCQSVCYRINVKDKGLLKESAIVVYAGSGKEDRILTGTYTELRRQEEGVRREKIRQQLERFDDFY